MEKAGKSQEGRYAGSRAMLVAWLNNYIVDSTAGRPVLPPHTLANRLIREVAGEPSGTQKGCSFLLVQAASPHQRSKGRPGAALDHGPTTTKSGLSH